MKKIIAFIISAAFMAAMLVSTAFAASFTDTSGHWASEYIDEAVELGFFTGNDDGTFDPDGNMTRAMFITTLGRAAEKFGFYTASDAAVSFTDINSGAYYAPYVSWAVENGITTGIDFATFAPDTPVTREQMCTFIIRFINNCLDADLSNYSSDISLFSDADSISEYARENVGLCVALGLINGIEDNDVTVFAPMDTATRAQVSVVLVKFNKAVYDLEIDLPDEVDIENQGGKGSESAGEIESADDPIIQEEHTEEELAEEAEVVGYLENISANSKGSASAFIGRSSQEVQDCITILIDCIDDALEQHYKGQFLSKEYIRTRYSAEISDLKVRYNALTDDDVNRLSNVCIRLETEEHINIVMDYFGVHIN